MFIYMMDHGLNGENISEFKNKIMVTKLKNNAV